MADKNIHSLSEVNVDESKLLRKGYSAVDLVSREFTIETVEVTEGEKGEYLVCGVSGDGIDTSRSFNTGCQNIVAKLKQAAAQGLLPVSVTVIKLGGRAYDIK